uniref:Tripartite motif containing 35-12 n=1 Tax=Salarias fasciatus TaxID=181472 RepID=A0A672FZJ3_SALFA
MAPLNKMSDQTETDLSCPVCRKIFTDPVLLLCSHSFCKDCLQTCWRQRGSQQCPVCREISDLNDPPRNLVLKNLCEAFLLKRQQRVSEPLCSRHSEKLRLFCLDHQELVCSVCRDSKTHTNHRIRPVDEAAKDHREELQKSLKPLQEKLEAFNRAEVQFDQTVDLIEVQAGNTKRQISAEFQKLHQFLKEEEEARMAALREEEEQKSQRMKEKIQALNRERSALSDTIRSSQEKLRAADILFLQNYKAAVEEVQQRPLLEDPQLPSGALIDVAKHLGNLSFNIWKKMEEKVSYSPVILDPNTAHEDLMVCDDLTAVRGGGRQKLPDNPERVKGHSIVLGSEGFESGSHCWDVDVTNNNCWSVGVTTDTDQLTTYREIRFSVDLTLTKKLTRVRVHLDCDNKKLSFYDPDTNSHIYTFGRFKASLLWSVSPCKLFPYIHTSDEHPVKILPLSVSTEVKQLTVSSPAS